MVMQVNSDIGRFAIVPLWLIESVSPQALRLWALMWAEWADRDDASCYPSRFTMADRMACSVDSVDRYLRDLERAGAVTIERQARKDGSQTSNVYTLHVRPPLGKSAAPPSRTDAAPMNQNHYEPDPSVAIATSGKETRARGEKLLTPEFRAEMRQVFPEIDEEAEYRKATAHPRFQEVRNQQRYYRNWLARTDERRAYYQQGKNGNVPPKRSGNTGEAWAKLPGVIVVED